MNGQGVATLDVAKQADGSIGLADGPGKRQRGLRRVASLTAALVLTHRPARTRLIGDILVVLALGLVMTATGSAFTTAGHGVGWAIYGAVLIGILAVRGTYRARLASTLLDELAAIVAASLLAMAFSAGLFSFLGWHPEPAAVAMPAAAVAVSIAALRFAIGIARRTLVTRMPLRTRTVIVGAGYVGRRFAQRLRDRSDLGWHLVGYVDVAPPDDDVELDVPLLGGPGEIEGIVRMTGATQVVLAFSSLRDEELIPLVRRCWSMGVSVAAVPRLFDSVNRRAQLEHVAGLPLLRLGAPEPDAPAIGMKYALDRLLAGVVLICVSPVFVSLALAVRFTSRGPVFFRQRRVGLRGVEFDLLKFRSMRVPRPGETSGFVPRSGSAPGGVEGEDRRTPIGRFLRRSSLDELPQLLNVLRGDMSLVGPRPERPEFVELFEQELDRYADRHRVKAGMTGWAQVHGLRGQTSIADRVEYDNFYIENWSPWLELKTLLLTMPAVLRSSEGE